MHDDDEEDNDDVYDDSNDDDNNDVLLSYTPYLSHTYTQFLFFISVHCIY